MIPGGKEVNTSQGMPGGLALSVMPSKSVNPYSRSGGGLNENNSSQLWTLWKLH